jgi:hypothetical protein
MYLTYTEPEKPLRRKMPTSRPLSLRVQVQSRLGMFKFVYLILFSYRVSEFSDFWRMKAPPSLLRSVLFVLFLLRRLFPLFLLRRLFPLFLLRRLFPLLFLRRLFPLYPRRRLFSRIFILKDPLVPLVGFYVAMQLPLITAQPMTRISRSILLGLQN